MNILSLTMVLLLIQNISGDIEMRPQKDPRSVILRVTGESQTVRLLNADKEQIPEITLFPNYYVEYTKGKDRESKFEYAPGQSRMIPSWDGYVKRFDQWESVGRMHSTNDWRSVQTILNFSLYPNFFSRNDQDSYFQGTKKASIYDDQANLIGMICSECESQQTPQTHPVRPLTRRALPDVYLVKPADASPAETSSSEAKKASEAKKSSEVPSTKDQKAEVKKASEVEAKKAKKASPAEASPAEESPAETPLSEASPSEISPSEISPAEISPSETSPSEISPSEASPSEISPAETPPSEASPAETSPAETPPSEASPAEASPAEASPAEAQPVEGEPADPIN